jgi:predicted transcriptional regulator
LPKGENSREKTKQEILLMVSDGLQYKNSDFIKKIKSTNSKTTINKYIKELVNEDKMMVKLAGNADENFRPNYKITEKGLKKVEKVKMSMNFGKYLDELSDKTIKESAYRLFSMMDTNEGDIYVFRKNEYRLVPKSKKVLQAIEEAFIEKEKN